MKKKNCGRNHRELVNFQTIRKANSGDIEALHKVLEYYKKDIIRRSTKWVVDEYGQKHYWIDEELKTRIEIRLITTILKFDVTPR